MRFPADTCARRARASELATGSARDFYMRNKSIADTHRANGVAELRERDRERGLVIFSSCIVMLRRTTSFQCVIF